MQGRSIQIAVITSSVRLTPDEFAAKYDWQNDPEQVRLLRWLHDPGELVSPVNKFDRLERKARASSFYLKTPAASRGR